MRVARVITRLNVGGPSIQAIALSERLVDRGHETLLVHGRLGEGEGDMRYLFTDPRARVVFVPWLQRPVAPRRDLAAATQIYRELCRFKPDIVHTHMAKAGAAGRLAAVLYNRTRGRRRPARIVHTYHGHVLEGYFGAGTARAFIAAERALAHATDAVIAIAPRIADELLNQFHIGRREQYRVVPLGFDLSAFAAIGEQERAEARDALAIPTGVPVVTTVGRLTAIKQHGLFLDAAARIAREHRDTVFLIAGDGELRGDLERQAVQAGIADRVRFLGWRRDLATIYAATDVFLLTSRNEGTPVAIIESLASGVPAVSTDVGGVADVITTDAAGRLAPFGDADGLARHVLDLLRDNEARQRAGEQGRALVLGRFGIDRLVDDIDALYHDLAG